MMCRWTSTLPRSCALFAGAHMDLRPTSIPMRPQFGGFLNSKVGQAHSSRG